jgi:hypothetical protein
MFLANLPAGRQGRKGAMKTGKRNGCTEKNTEA